MLTIAVDAMGGDHAPKREVEGAIRAAEELQIAVILVGLEEVIRTELALHPQAAGLPIEVHHASEFITMDDSAAKAVRVKKDSSIRVACRLVRDGIAHGVVSAGNTGAVMATAKIVQGVIRGVTRPALAGAFPSLTGSPVVLLDVGANVDCKPEMLAQFAVMGEIYSRTIFHNSKPRVGLLSIGEEEHKGNDLTRAALPLLKALPINFIGNVEGRDIFNGIADVVIYRKCRAQGQRRAGRHVRQHAARLAQPDHDPQDRLAAFARGVPRVQEAPGLLRIRRCAAAGRERRLYHLAWTLQCQRRQERHTSRGRIRRGARE